MITPIEKFYRMCPRHSKVGRRKVGFRCCCEEMGKAWLMGYRAHRCDDAKLRRRAK